MRPSKAAAARLRLARAMLDRPFGWIKHASTSDRGDGTIAYCLGYAVVAARGTVADHDRVAAAIRQLHPNEDRAKLGVVTFNDDPRTTKVEVLAVLDKAIKNAEVTR